MRNKQHSSHDTKDTESRIRSTQHRRATERAREVTLRGRHSAKSSATHLGFDFGEVQNLESRKEMQYVEAVIGHFGDQITHQGKVRELGELGKRVQVLK